MKICYSRAKKEDENKDQEMKENDWHNLTKKEKFIEEIQEDEKSRK